MDEWNSSIGKTSLWKNGIPPLYKGKTMTPFDDKVNKYGDPNIRQENECQIMTTLFLKKSSDS